MAKKEWSESKQGYHMDAEKVYLFRCPNCKREYFYNGGITVRWCGKCKNEKQEKPKA